MLQKLLSWIRKVANRLIPKQNIAQALHVETEVSGRMAAAVDLWMRLYTGRSPWLWDEKGIRDENVQTLGLPASIAAKVAKMVTLEMKTGIAGSARANYLAMQMHPVLDNIRRYTEYACAQGGLVLKPYIDGADIAVDLTQADCFYPTAFNSRGEVTGAVFAEQITRGNRYYTRLEHHDLRDGGYHIVNRAFVSRDRDALGAEIPLEQIPEWADIEPEATITGVTQPLFAYFRIPQANTIDTNSPLGVSVYSRAVDLIREADMQYSRILWEYEGSELAIDVDITTLQTGWDGTPTKLPKGKDRLYRGLNLSGGAKEDFYKPYAPAIRDASLYNGLNKQFQQIERVCGLSFGTLSDPQSVDKTATEIKASKQDMYTTITDIQKGLRAALEQLLYAIDVWTTVGALAPRGAYELTVQFDDSILNDPDVQKQQDAQDVRDGLMAKWEYRAKWYGESEDIAKARISEIGKQEDTDPFGFNRQAGGG